MWGFSSRHSKNDDDLNADDGHQRRQTVDEKIYEGLLDKEQLRRHNRHRYSLLSEEDPFDSPAGKKEEAKNFRDMFTRGVERSRDTWSDIKTATPFSYYAQSFKHGIWVSREVRVGYFWIGFLVLFFGTLLALDARHDQPDSQYFKTVIKTNQKLAQ